MNFKAVETMGEGKRIRLFKRCHDFSAETLKFKSKFHIYKEITLSIKVFFKILCYFFISYWFQWQDDDHVNEN